MKAAVIVEPEVPENTGFIARLAANFEFELRVVNPDFNLEESKKTASRAQQKLREAKIFETVEEAVEDLEFVVGTKPGRGVKLNGFEARENTSVMIGSESSGLKNSELDLCDAVVHIETGDYESINQSHAASIIMHHFYNGSKEKGIESKQKDFLDNFFQTPILRKLLMRSNPSYNEVNRLIGQIKEKEDRDPL